MKASIITGALVALFTGIAITLQSTLASRAGSIIGDLRTGILINAMGGLIAGTLISLSFLWKGPQMWRVPRIVIAMTAVSGLLGVSIVTGISFSLQRAGVAAGLASVILGQLVFSFLIDAFGIGGVEAIPLSFSRVLGILITGFGVYLLLPKA